MTAPTPTPSDAELMALIRAAAEGASISISRVGGRHWGVSLERHQPGAYRFWGTAPELHAALAQCLEEAAKRGLVVKAAPQAPAPAPAPAPTQGDQTPVACRLARALLDVLDGIPDDAIWHQTSATESEVPGVIRARAEARALLGLEPRRW